MDISNLTVTQATLLATQVTWGVCLSICVFFLIATVCSKRGKANEYVSYAPNLLTSLGIFGTFAGIVVGLMAFDANNIDGSVEGLLNGLKTAFLTSIVGIIASIAYKLLHSTGLIRPSEKIETVSSATPEGILNAINLQRESIDSLVRSIGGEGDGSVISQMKLLRDDLNDSQKQSLNYQKESSEKLLLISEQLTTQKAGFDEFKDKLWIKMQDFADMLSKSATETVIEALKQVITDFNNNLTEQFGENFKQLNEAVKELVTWQENYKVQISEMTEQYKLGVASIAATEESVSKISTESKVIPQSMEDLKQVMQVNQHQLNELERHLDAFKDIRDRAVEAVPEIRKQVDETVKAIADSVKSATTHYNTLLTESNAFIQKQMETSNNLLDNFVNNTKEGVDSISEKLRDSATKLETVITEGAEEFTEKVHQTNSGLQSSADHITSQTEIIKDHLKLTVEDLNENVRSMVNSLVEDAKQISSTLVDANKSLATDTSSVRDSLTQSIESMQKRLESSMEEVYASQTKHMQQVFSNVDASLKDQVGKTGEAVEKQLAMIDQSMQQELNKVMSVMGTKLGQIAGQFVQDYSRLTEQMSKVVNKAG